MEDIKAKQEEEAEKTIRLHFQMEQIVYCQDQEYRAWLQKIREKEVEQQKKKLGFVPCENILSQSFLDEIHQHLWAYHQVSLRLPPKGGFHPFSCLTVSLRCPRASSVSQPFVSHHRNNSP